jgi:hypothetical protein
MKHGRLNPALMNETKQPGILKQAAQRLKKATADKRLKISRAISLPNKSKCNRPPHFEKTTSHHVFKIFIFYFPPTT